MATLYVTEPGARIEKEYQRILITRQDEVLRSVPLARISEVALVGPVGATTPALLMLLEAGVGLSFISRAGRLRGRLAPPAPRNIPARQAQYAAAQDPAVCLRVGRAIVEGKLRNSRTLALRILRGRPELDPAPLDRLARNIEAAPRAPDLAALRGLEGSGARAYFAVLAAALPPEMPLERRSRRPPRDPVNAMLSLGYSLLAQNLMTAIELAGMDPYEGLYHADKHGRPALALDLMEEFRPVVVDSVLLTLVNKRMVGPEDFRPGRRGGVWLRRSAQESFFGEYSRRLETRILHPFYGRRLSYRQCFEAQARLLRKTIMGELEDYAPFLVK
ncbi:MAG: CRISPR-associated endonuclease Cas1 [Chloroflexia bacterium]|nr:CRISPR-associated endonuclease Cas1 [Chloroflexia bacterium]